ncbi:MAG: hypothetical protein AB7E95_12650 [Kiritimatiellales bacterium]
MFEQGLPVWFPGLEKEKNLYAGFRAVFSVSGEETATLHLAGSTLYRVFLNGEFIQHGPARGPHGFYRVDEICLNGRVREGDNLLAVEVVGYNCHSFAYLNQPSFLQAEILVGERVAAATGRSGFDALRLPERIQKVERYSFQRPFAEAYRLAPGFDDWRTRIDAKVECVPCTVQAEKNLLPRGVAFSDFRVLSAGETVGSGTVDYAEKPEDRSVYWWMSSPNYNRLESFRPEEFERNILQTYQACSFHKDSGASGGNRYQIFDMGTDLTGFIRLRISCAESARLIAVFDEVLVDGDINPARGIALNMVYYEIEPGDYELETIEPYTFRYLKVIALNGVVAVYEAGLREYVNAEASRAQFECSDTDLNLLFEAGRQTFRQNATDIYMDCPGRERAGWLCDSFFTGRVEPLLCGSSKVERNFIENFSLPENFGAVPDGMLPMCYPAENLTGWHIPQWAMWLVLELEEYQRRSGDSVLIQQMRPKIEALLNYLRQFENSEGLLEKLPSKNFIEWSKANELVDDVSYPTNMLYARMLESAARLYGKDDLFLKAAQIHQTVRQQSFNGTFFVDNALRDESGALRLSGESTEVCQYYAFFCGTASPDGFSNLWKILLEEFGPDRAPNGSHQAVWPANAFIGYYLRMELLSRHGEPVRLLKELKGYFLGMARRTGTLWEHCDLRASCNHGFASHICVHLFRDVLGVSDVNPVEKTVFLHAPDLPLKWCRGKIPVGDEWIELEWTRGTDGVVSRVANVPPDWRVERG